MGCHVITTCSTANVDLCRSLGADRVVDYKKEVVLEALIASGKKFDHAVDNVGHNKELIWRCHEYLKPGAVCFLVAGDFSLGGLMDAMKRKVLPGFLGGMVEGFLAQPVPEHLEKIGEWMSSGQVRAVIDERFRFKDVVKAFEKLKTGRARGKIVVDVKGPKDGKGEL